MQLLLKRLLFQISTHFQQYISTSLRLFSLNSPVSSSSNSMHQIRFINILADNFENYKEKNKEQRVKVRRYLKQGFSRERVFIRLCKHLQIVTVAQAADSFERIEDDWDISYRFDEADRRLFMMILAEIGKKRGAIAKWEGPFDSDVLFLDSRYAIHGSASDLKQGHMYLLDNFYGQRKQIEVEGIDLKEADDYYIEIIEFNRLFLIQCSHNNNWFLLHLMQLDFNKLTCTQLSTEMLGGYYGKTFIDRQNLNNFVVWFGAADRHNRYLCLGRVVDSEIVMEQRSIEFMHRPVCMRLVGNLLQTLVSGNIHVGSEDGLGEFELVSGQNYPPMLKLFTTSMANLNSSLVYYWVGNKCYFASSEYSRRPQTVFRLDTDKEKMIKTEFKFYGDTKIEDIFVDKEEQQLTLFVEHRLEEVWLVYRFLIGPDTLNNQCLFALRRETMFFGAPFPPLPNSMRPFAICPPDEEPSTSSSN